MKKSPRKVFTLQLVITVKLSLKRATIIQYEHPFRVKFIYNRNRRTVVHPLHPPPPRNSVPSVCIFMLSMAMSQDYCHLECTLNDFVGFLQSLFEY